MSEYLLPGGSPKLSPKEAVNRAQQVEFYTDYYAGREKGDSPDKSRLSIIRRSIAEIRALPESAVVLDLGSGKQALSREYRQFGYPNCTIVSADLADIGIQIGHPKLPLIRADGRALPFRDGSLSLAVSNMAFDFMGKDAIPSLRRALLKGAPVHFNFHHPTLIPEDVDKLLAEVSKILEKTPPKLRKSKDIQNHRVYRQWKYLRDNNILYTNKNEILETFKDSFHVKSIEEESERPVAHALGLGELFVNNYWWAVDMEAK